MKVFVDECVTYDLMPYLTGHDFTHIADTTWRSTKNGVLLRLVEADYDVFLTKDTNLRFQQNLRKFNLVFVVLKAKSNDLPDLLPLVPDTLAVLDSIALGQSAPGDLYEIEN